MQPQERESLSYNIDKFALSLLVKEQVCKTDYNWEQGRREESKLVT